jgi:N-carbamoyl-L-amino-acid hydrolase
VTTIAAAASLQLVIQGEGGHAGAVLMSPADEIALAVEAGARSSGSIDTVATVGVCEVFPGAVNSVPSRVRIEIDVRDTN